MLVCGARGRCVGACTSEFGDSSRVIARACVIQKTLFRLAPETGVKHVCVQWRIGGILPRVVRTQQDVFVHSL